MAKMKDFFGIASNGFNHTVRNSRDENRDGDRSLIEMLEKFGSLKEKKMIQQLKKGGKLSVDGKSLKTKLKPVHFGINPWQ